MLVTFIVCVDPVTANSPAVFGSALIQVRSGRLMNLGGPRLKYTHVGHPSCEVWEGCNHVFQRQ